MKGFQILSKSDSIDETRNGAGHFLLKAFDDRMEIFQVLIKPGKSILCLPKDCVGQLNACIVISGKIRHEISGRILKAGDMFAYQDMNEIECFKTLEESLVVMLAEKGHFSRKLGRINQFYEQIDLIHERDGYTGDHCEAVGNLGAKLATILKLNEQQTDNILLAGKVHDLGKVMIPDRILNKPGKLTPEEFDVMKRHTLYAYDMVMEKTNNSVIAEIVKNHHERLNGSGYPFGIQGDAISMETRVISVVDAYNAMTTDRPYKKAMESKDALMELQQQKWTLYDPRAVEALVLAVNE